MNTMTSSNEPLILSTCLITCIAILIGSTLHARVGWFEAIPIVVVDASRPLLGSDKELLACAKQTINH